MNLLKNKMNKLAKTLFIFAFAMMFVLSSQVVHAQMLDEILLDGIKEQSSGSKSSDSDLDKAREDAEEEDIDRAHEATLEIAENVSLLEEDFRSRIGQEVDDENGLSQFGYDIFSSVSLSANASVGSIPANYILGVGDKLVVSFVGAVDRSDTVDVDREGRVIISELSPINASGRSFASFEAELKEKVSEAMLGTDVFVSLGSVRHIGVYVLGEVSMPGLHNLTSLSTVLQALAKAGGVKKTGSLRSIVVESGGLRTNYDLYEFMSSPTAQNILLNDGARVIVPTIGRTVAVTGKVARPAIYELARGKENIRWEKLLSFSGNTLRPRGNDFSVNRFEEDGTQKFKSLDLISGNIISGDIVAVNFKRDVLVGEVYVSGHVQVEGSRSLASYPTLSALFGSDGAFGPTPYLPFAVIETIDTKSRARVYKSINLEKVLDGSADAELKDRDKIVVFSAEDIEFLSDPLLRRVILTGQYEVEEDEDECTALGDLASFVTNFGRDRFSIISRNIYIETDNKEEEESKDIRQVNPKNIALEHEQRRNRDDMFESEDEGVLSIEDVAESEELSCTAIYEDNKGLLAYALEHVASINGSVRMPGLFPVANEVSLSSIISFAGGFSRDADITNIEVLQVESNLYSPDERTQRVLINSKNQNLEDVVIKANYSVRANPRSTDQETGTVLLSGEFVRPGVYAIIKGEKLSELIERAGGLTEFSYPIGAIFTRLSAKESQQESFRRAAREINSALAVASVRSEVDADAIVAAQNLADELQSVEALGRVVVEADVSILRVKPELDTILEPGDKIIMPKRPNFVVLGGDVLNPSALQFVSGKEVKTYIAEAGGIQRSADKDRIFIVHPNGVASPVNVSGWRSADVAVLPGSTIIVPKNLDPLTTFERVTVLTQILSQLALSAASIAVIAN